MTDPVSSELSCNPQTLETSENAAGEVKEAEISRVGAGEETREKTASCPNRVFPSAAGPRHHIPKGNSSTISHSWSFNLNLGLDIVNTEFKTGFVT